MDTANVRKRFNWLHIDGRRFDDNLAHSNVINHNHVIVINQRKEREHLEKERKKAIPIFETSIAIYSTYAAVVMFWTPGILSEAESGIFYRMNALAPQWVWAFTFFIAGMTKAFGLLLKHVQVRRIGLFLSCLIYGSITICYGYGFPNMGTGLFAVLTIMSIVTIATVERSEI